MMKWIKTIFVVIVFILCIIVAVMTKQTKIAESGANLGLGLAQVLTGLAVLATLALVVKNLINNPKGAIRIGIGLLVMVILYFIGSGMDAGEVYPDYNVTSGVSKRVGGLLFLTYALGIVSAIAFVAALVMSIIKK